MFYGGDTYNYTIKALYLLRIATTNYVNKPLRDIILGLILVNTSGREDGFYPIDLTNEIFNSVIK